MHQFVAVSAVSTLLVIAALVATVAAWTQSSALESAEGHLRTELHGARQLLDLAYDVSIAETDKVAAILVSRFPDDMVLREDRRVMVGAFDAPVLEYAGLPLNLDFAPVDDFTAATGGVATVFARTGEDFVRVTTSLKNEKGERAIGTLLARDHPAYRKLLAGETYLGPARLFGRQYMTKYVPRRGADGKVNAILFVGFDLTDILASLGKSVGALRFGETGYAFVFRADGKEKGVALFHPALAGANLAETPDAAGGHPFRDMLSGESGHAVFPWKDAQGKARPWLAAYERTPAWGGLVVAGGTFRDELLHDAVALRNAIVAAGVVAALLLGAMLFFFIRSRLVPVARLVEALERLGSGDLTVRVGRAGEGRTRNELDLIAAKIDETGERIAGLIAHVRADAATLAEAARSLTGTAAALEASAGTQNEATTSVAAGVEQMSVSVGSVSDNAQDASRFTERTRTLCDSGSGAIARASDQIRQIASAVGEAGTAIGRLGSESQRISAAVVMIRDIAEQTNLLALNAAIEAARAGEQGRGFSVVADQVRTLAERTTAATQEITDMVSAIQEGAGRAVDGMQGSLGLVEEGVTLVTDSGQIMQTIDQGATDAVAVVSDIAAALREQAATSRTIGAEVERISRLTEETRVSARQASEVAGRVEALSAEMLGAVSRFRLAA